MSTADQILFYKWMQERDARAFKSLTSQYCGMVYGTCMRILRNPADAEDVTQECFTILAVSKKGPTGSLGAWLHRVATHHALNHRRSENRRRAREERFAKSRPLSAEPHWDDVSGFIDEAIERLPDKLRETIVSHFIDDQSVTAIAADEGVTHGAITQRIQKGVLVVRESLKQRGVTVGATALAAMFHGNSFAISIEATALPKTLGKIALSGRAAAPELTGSSLFGTKGFLTLGAITAIVVGVFVFVTPSESKPLQLSRVEPQVRSVPEPISESGPAPIVAFVPQPEPAAADVVIASQEPTATTIAAEDTVVPEAVKIDDWRDVLQAYTAHQNRIRSITVEYEHSMKGDYFHSSHSPEPGYREAYQRGILSTDGERCYIEQYRWGHWFGGEILPEERPDIHACVWNGADVVEYHGGGGSWYGTPGSLQLHLDALNSWIRDSAFNQRRSYLIFGRYPGSKMLGYPVPTGHRIDEYLYESHDVSLRPEMESVGGVDCYVLDAEGDYGTFAVWFDPIHDFNVAKHIIAKRPGHLIRDQPVTDGTAIDHVYEVKRFVKVDDLWVPKESTSRDRLLGLGGEGYDYTHHHERTSITLNADSDDDNTYVLHAEYIPNGARWMNTENREDQTEYIWYNGKVVEKTKKHKIPSTRSMRRAQGLIAGGVGAGASR